MDSFGVHKVTSEKTNAGLFKYRSFQKLNVTFCILEVCVFLIIISRFTTHLLDAFKLSGDYFRGLSVTATVSPVFVFFIGNIIVIVLFLKSRQTKDSASDPSIDPITDLHDDYAKSYEKNQHEHEIKKEKKKSVCIVGDQSLIRSDGVACTVKEEKKISRSRSEIFKKVNHHHKGSCRELRRSVTERRRQLKSVDFCEEKWVSENEMSNEEFRRTIEAFIARQQRVLREEDNFSSDLSFEHNI